MFPYAYQLLSEGETEDSGSLVRELAVHLWGRIRSATESVVRLADRWPLPNRESLMRPPF